MKVTRLSLERGLSREREGGWRRDSVTVEAELSGDEDPEVCYRALSDRLDAWLGFQSEAGPGPHAPASTPAQAEAKPQAQAAPSPEPQWKPQRDGGEFCRLEELPEPLREKLKAPKTRLDEGDYHYRSWQGLKGEVLVSRYRRKGDG